MRKRISFLLVASLLLVFSVSGEVLELDVSLSDLDAKYVFESISAKVVMVDDEDLIVFNDVNGEEVVVRDHRVGLFLQDSVSLVGADYFWDLNNESYTGVGQSVCVIDTGVDFTHDVFGGEFGVVVVGGKRFIGSEVVDCAVNNSACLDDHGHGTHVAGIVKAMAPGVSVVAVKVLDGSGWGLSSDVAKGIDYCISVADEFNISVISMSLGAPCFDEHGSPTGLCHTSFCDAQYPSYAALINEAVSKNISVVVATGNSALSNAVSSPSCVESAFRVASSTKSDAISWFSNIWAGDVFLAPGSSINSTDLDNGFRTRSGTSMATPHVSGAAVLVREYLGVGDPVLIKGFLFDESVLIYDDFFDRNFSRLNLVVSNGDPELPLPDPEPEPEPDPEDPIIVVPDEIVNPPRRGGGGGGSPDVVIFDETSLVISDTYIDFSEMTHYFRDLVPGDLLLMSDDSVYSKFLVPKKWKHAVIYLGTEYEVRSLFGADSDIYNSLKEYFVRGNEVLVIDSSVKGVSVRDIRDFGYVGITGFRPVHSLESNELMISYAVSQIGKPYDKLFSTRDEAFYCSELMFKSLNEAGFGLSSSKFVWFNEVILPSDLVAQFSERDDFEFLFYVAKQDGVFLVKEEADLFDGHKYPVLGEIKSLFLEKGLLSYALWVLVLWLVYAYFFKSKKVKKSRRRRGR